MKTKLPMVVVVVLCMVAMISFSLPAHADEVKIVGTLSKIEIAADKKSATALLKVPKSGAEVSVIVNDELTVGKFLDQRIVEGDEIRCRYEKVDGKNISRYFKKAAGC